MRLFARLLSSNEAQDMAEYGIALSIIGAGTVIVALIVNGPIVTLWEQASAIITTAAV